MVPMQASSTSAKVSPASATEPAVLTATIDPIGSRAMHSGNPFNQPLRDRRDDLYAEMLGSAHAPGEY